MDDKCECGKPKDYGKYFCDPCHESFKDALNSKFLQEFSESVVGNEELETSAKPTRYNKTGAVLEVWDAIKQLDLNYMQGNVLKYVSRYKNKKGPEDLCKAINYIIKMIAQETGEDYYELHKLTPEELAKRVKK